MGREAGLSGLPRPRLLANFQQLLRYRALIRTLVARELKARYRGTVLGFLWSFVNPLLYLLVYTFVFTVVMPGLRPADLQPFALFLFCGILPWTWFSSSLLEASNVLIAGGNLIRKVLFPAEVLPLVSVFSGLANFCFGLPILAAFLLYYRVPVVPSDLLWFPVIVVVQLTLTAGLSLLLSAFTVHFRDIRDLLQNLLMLWFFATPIINPLSSVPEDVRWIVELNPFTHLAVAYQEVLFRGGPFTESYRLGLVGGVAAVVFVVGYAVFDRLRDTLAEEV
jgi:ABC-type polysaccharide/polyol phosphate export permease